MKLCFLDSPISRTLRPLFRGSGPSLGHLTTLQAHSPPRHLNHSFYLHPRVTQLRQCCQMCRVFNQALLPSFTIAKLAFDYPERCSTLSRMLALIFFNLSRNSRLRFISVTNSNPVEAKLIFS